MTNSEMPSDQLDRATRERLAKLAAMPIDSSKLRSRLRHDLATEQPGGLEHPVLRRLTRWPAAVAAAVLAAALIGVLVMVSFNPQPALAVPADMAQLHQQLVAQSAPMIAASNMDQVRREIARQWSDAPGMPALTSQPAAPAPAEHVMACCIHHVQGKKVACVLLKGKTPVTMVVARAADVKPAPAQGQTVQRDGHQYVVHQTGQLNMVMTVREGRYICLMGELPQSELIDLGEGLTF